ncbi:MAG: DUF423 domain-containing protein [Longimicrobiales bacterium]
MAEPRAVMERQARLFATLGAVNAGLAVLLGAFGAHALRDTLSADHLATFGTAVDYHLVHALGLFAVAFVGAQLPGSTLLRWSGRLMSAGIVLFCGSLYALALTGLSRLGAITPLGGVCFTTAWILLALALIRDWRPAGAD